MPSRIPADRRSQAIKAANHRWAHTSDRTAATAPARDAFERRFETEVDPDRTLDPDERAYRASRARKAYYAGLALKSAQARRKDTTAP